VRVLRGRTRHNVEQFAVASNVHQRDSYSVQPGNGIQSNSPTVTNDDQSFEVSIDTTEPSNPPSAPDPIFDDEVATLNGDPETVAAQRDDFSRGKGLRG